MPLLLDRQQERFIFRRAKGAYETPSIKNNKSLQNMNKSLDSTVTRSHGNLPKRGLSRLKPLQTASVTIEDPPEERASSEQWYGGPTYPSRNSR